MKGLSILTGIGIGMIIADVVHQIAARTGPSIFTSVGVLLAIVSLSLLAMRANVIANILDKRMHSEDRPSEK